MNTEKAVLDLWDSHNVFELSVQKRKNCPAFVIYEGPPTANGKPGIHHVLTRTVKDIIARFWTMNGRYVDRKAGWDEHGLPVEIGVQKANNLNSKKEIVGFGVEKFNAACAESTQKYIGEWEALTKRMGYWLDFTNAYRTSDDKYIHRVWNVLKELCDQGLIYKSDKIVPWAWDSETALSNSEVAQGYKDILTVSAYVGFKIDVDTYLVAWTTTPWTLPANQALAVNRKITYEVYNFEGYKYIVRKGCTLFKDKKFFENAKYCNDISGEELLKKNYAQPFNGSECFVDHADFVQDDKTGVVHIAPAFGQDDYNFGKEHQLEPICHVDPNGLFNDKSPEFLKEKHLVDRKNNFTYANSLVLKNLNERGFFVFMEELTHQYPHNWRTDAPLIYYMRPSFYVATTKIKDKMIAANQKVVWYPNNIKDGRFGTWLENVVDWSISRDRFWGTPLPFVEIDDQEKEGWYFKRPENCHKQLNDKTAVLDCWFDSGAMPFAAFDAYQQADVICEAVDQTRGWFYTLTVLGTALKGEAPFRKAICLGHVVDSDKKKMSKSRGNAIDPMEVFGKEGADPVRWMMASVPVGHNFEFSENELKPAKVFLNRLWNVFTFLKTYSDIEKYKFQCWRGYSPYKHFGYHPLDNWILLELNRTVEACRVCYEDYDFAGVCREASEYLDKLSNIWVRMNRSRFWNTKNSIDKDAFEVLFHCLTTFLRVIAPIVPFITEMVWHGIYADAIADGKTSIHWEDYPSSIDADRLQTFQTYSVNVDNFLAAVDYGQSMRKASNIKVKQPLQRFSVPEDKPMNPILVDILKEELNVKEIKFYKDAYSLTTTLTEELKTEGKAREFRRLLQSARKEAGFTVTDRIFLSVDAKTDSLFYKHKEWIMDQCLISEWSSPIQASNVKTFKIDDHLVLYAIGKQNG